MTTVTSSTKTVTVAGTTSTPCQNVAGYVVINGQTICMNWKLIDISWPPSSTMGYTTVYVNSGNKWSGTYPNIPYYIDSQGYIWVWPHEEFSLKSVNPVEAS